MRAIGNVKWFDRQRGYGFIIVDSGRDVFVHYSAVNSRGYRVLNEGQHVSFDLVQGLKGPQAENVTVLH